MTWNDIKIRLEQWTQVCLVFNDRRYGIWLLKRNLLEVYLFLYLVLPFEVCFPHYFKCWTWLFYLYYLEKCPEGNFDNFFTRFWTSKKNRFSSKLVDMNFLKFHLINYFKYSRFILKYMVTNRSLPCNNGKCCHADFGFWPTGLDFSLFE